MNRIVSPSSSQALVEARRLKQKVSWEAIDFGPRELPPYDCNHPKPPPYEHHSAGQYCFDEPCEWLPTATQHVRQEMRQKSAVAGDGSTGDCATGEDDLE